MYKKSKILASGDSGIILEVGDGISEEVNRKIRALSYCIERMQLKEIIEIIPTYTTVLVLYNPLETSYKELAKRLMDIEESIDDIELPPREVVHIPILYGGEYGTDLEHVAKHNKLTVEEVIDIHSGTNYLVYMLGFTPGFPYLGGMSERISTPRLETPREKITAGSVGIAGNQTGIYPIDSPGGWQLIGRTPLNLFDAKRKPSVLLKAGQYLKFQPICKEEYEVICKEIKESKYSIKKTMFKEGEYNV
ncbi:5-oxoprolinase subunit PxpB [Wukongibacter baidiensis]|uniref:5-oxoprolinase subunit PxpB n=1 Tax=Wukongibacter baidiensis TaxID=1723361 RepID=UPI003D7FF15C